jgi:hypothetical protein
MSARWRVNAIFVEQYPGCYRNAHGTSNVDTVLIAGKVMKPNGKLIGVDLNSIRRTVESSRDAVLARAKYRRDLFRSCCADAQ